METFLRLAEDKFKLNAVHEEILWLQALYQSTLDKVYDSKSWQEPVMTCEELCLQILNVLVELNGNLLPISHKIISIGDLLTSYNKDFCGIIGDSTEVPSQECEGFKPLEKQHVILMGKLTAFPETKTSLINGSGLLYLEDKTGVIICQINNPRKEWLSKIVVLQKWNLVCCSNFPMVIFEGDTVEISSKFCYIEVDKDSTACIHDRDCQSVCEISQTLSVEEFVQMKKPSKRLNLKGCLKGLSPVHRYTQHDSNGSGKPFFLAELSDTESTVIVFQGEQFSHWRNFLHVGRTYSFRDLHKTTMNRGKPSERSVLAATKTSDFCLMDVEISAKNDEPSDKAKRNREDEQPARDKRLKEAMAEPSTKSIVKLSSKTEKLWFSPLIAYQGVITAVVDVNYGVYEVDHKMRLYTHLQPCPNFGCGMRVGAVISLQNYHFCKLNEGALALCCCTYSSMEITKYSTLASPFKASVPAIAYFYRISERLSLVQFVGFLHLLEVLLTKFRPPLCRTEIVGPRNALRSSASVPSTILSHVLDLNTLVTSSSRDVYGEFFDRPHSCLVSKPLCDHDLPHVQTLQDTMDFIDQMGTQQDNDGDSGTENEEYGWNYREVTENDFPENIILLGWLSSCAKTGQLFFCDQTASIPCIVAETEEATQALHKCTATCLKERKLIKPGILKITDVVEVQCPVVCPSQLGTILKLGTFKIIIEAFDCHSNTTATTHKKIYVVFSWRRADIIGRSPTLAQLTTKFMKTRKALSVEEETPENETKRCFVFLVKYKELCSLDLKVDRDPTLASCVHGYILGEVKGKKGLMKSHSTQLSAYKKSMILQIFKDCTSLAYLRPGCLYYLTESCSVVKSMIQVALDDKQGCAAVVHFNPMMTLSEVDASVLCHDVYEDWAKLVDGCLKIDSVRDSLERRNQEKDERDVRSKCHKEPMIHSFRGIITDRDLIISSQSEATCPLPSIPSGKMYLPRYGLISQSQAQALSLTSYFLADRQLVLTVRDVNTLDTVKVYFGELSGAVLPLGLLPGAMVTFTQVTNNVSRKGNVYFSFTACSDLIVECLPAISLRTNQAIPTLLKNTAVKEPTEQDSLGANVPSAECRDLIVFANALRDGAVVPTVTHVTCRVAAVQSITLRWACLKCAKLSNECCCSVARGNERLEFTAKAKCLVDDGTCDALLFVDNDQVRNLLGMREKTWESLKDFTCGEVFYQRSAFWRAGLARGGGAGSGGKAADILARCIFSSSVLRRINVLCKQFKMSGNSEPGQAFESRTIMVDKKEHWTYVFGKVMLQALNITDVDILEQTQLLLNSLQRL